MVLKAFDTAIVDDGEALVGPWRTPQQMLATQVYDGHVSIHDDAMAQKVGFKAATIEGPTHFSQFDPLCERLWGDAWFETGCISAHYRNAVFAGEDVQAVVLKPKQAQSQVAIRMVKRDGTEVLQGTASVGRDNSATALDKRLRDELKPLTDPVILRDVKVGMKTRRQSVRMDFDQNMGELYPFSLRDKLKVITEPSPLYQPDRAADNKWRRAIIPFEMLSVLFQYRSRGRSAADQGTGGRLVRRSGNPAARRAAVRRRKLRARARSGGAQRQPAHREPVGAHHRLCPAERPPGGDDAAQSRQHQGLAARLCRDVRGAVWVRVASAAASTNLSRSLVRYLIWSALRASRLPPKG